MIALILIPVYLTINYIVLNRTLKYLGAWHDVFKKRKTKIIIGSVYVVFMFSPLLGFMIKSEPWHVFFKVMGNYWLGIFEVSIVSLLIYGILWISLKLTFWRGKPYDIRRLKYGGTAVVLAVMMLCSYGFAHSGTIKINKYDIDVNKKLVLEDKPEKKSTLKIALVADTHIGYSIGEKQIQKMVDKINSQNPDLVIIAGDIFDNEYRAVRNPEKIKKIFRSIKSRYGVYAVWGNHDIPEALLSGFTLRGKEPYKEEPEFKKFLEESNVKLLEDKSLLVKGKFYLFGRKDYSMTEKLGEKRKEVSEFTEEFDRSKPIIMVDHQPRELEKASESGVDVALSGHTHNGQIFPGNLTVKIPWENPYGILKKGNMTSAVTSGVGIWGPKMRIGSDAEIMMLNVNFKK